MTLASVPIGQDLGLIVKHVVAPYPAFPPTPGSALACCEKILCSQLSDDSNVHHLIDPRMPFMISSPLSNGIFKGCISRLVFFSVLLASAISLLLVLLQLGPHMLGSNR